MNINCKFSPGTIVVKKDNLMALLAVESVVVSEKGVNYVLRSFSNTLTKEADYMDKHYMDYQEFLAMNFDEDKHWHVE